MPTDNKTPHCLQALQGSGGRWNSAFFDLAEFKLHWRGATKDENSHLNTAFLIINFFNNTIEVGKGTVGNPNNLTRFKQCLWLGLVAAVGNAAQDGFSFAIGNGCRLVCRTTDEAEYARGILDQVPGAFVHFHLNQHIAREEFALALALLTVAHFHHFFGGHKDLTKLIFHSGQLDPLLERAHHVLLESGVGMYDVPTLSHGAPLANELRNNPTQQGIEPPVDQGHDHNNSYDDQRCLSGFRTSWPDDLADLDACFFEQRPEGLAFFGLQGNKARHQAERNQRYGTIQNRFGCEIMITVNADKNEYS